MEISYSDKTVLIVDNRLEDLGALKIILGRMGVSSIQVASSVNMAMILLREQQFDLCFVEFDLGQDQKNGLQLIQEASAEQVRLFSTVFVLVVEPERSKLLFGSLDSSPDIYISKPYAEAKVRHRIEKIMRIKTVLRPLEQLLDQGALEQALQMCDKLMRQFPALRLYIQRIQGIILLESGQHQQAEALFSDVLQSRELPWAQVGLGLSLCHLGHYLQAQACLQQVIDDSHFCVEAYAWLARTYYALGQRGEAISLLRKAVMLQPTVPELLGALGSLAAQNQEWTVAVDAYRSAIRFARHSVYQSDEYYFSLVGALLAKEGIDAAVHEEMIRALENAVLAFPDEPIVQFKSRLMAARVFRESGATDQADLAAHNAFDLFKDLPLTEQAAWIDPFVEGMEGSPVEEVAHELKARTSRDMASLEWGKLNIQGMLAYKKKAFRQALGYFVRADGLLPNNPSVMLNLVQAALEQARASDTERQELLLRSDNALYNLNFGALSGRQQKRFHSLAERCSSMIKQLLDKQSADV